MLLLFDWYYEDMSCNNAITKISGLAALFKTDVTWDGLVQKWSFWQCRYLYFKWSGRTHIPNFPNGIQGVIEMTHVVQCFGI